MRGPEPVLALVVAALGSAPAAAAPPPINTPIRAVAALRGPDLEGAVRSVDVACRGSSGRALRDQAPLLAEARRLAASQDPERRRRALDLHRCFSESRFLSELLFPRLEDQDPSVVAYALEVGARLESAAVAATVLEGLRAEVERCLSANLPEAAIEVCVWLTYTPSTGLEAAARGVRAKAGHLAAQIALDAPYAKMREVAVETLAATRLQIGRAHV